MEKLTKENWLSGHEQDKCFFLRNSDGKMIADVESNKILTCEIDWHGYTTLAEAKQLAEWVLKADPDYKFSIVAVPTTLLDEEEMEAYLHEYGTDFIYIESYND